MAIAYFDRLLRNIRDLLIKLSVFLLYDKQMDLLPYTF